jgi:hypothetical protein
MGETASPERRAGYFSTGTAMLLRVKVTVSLLNTAR